MPWFSTFSPYGNGNMHHLAPKNSSTKIETDLLNFKNEKVGVGRTRFRNSAGGRIVVMGMSVTGNLSASLSNYRRGRLIQDLVMWAGAQNLVFVQDQPRIFCILNLPQNPNDNNIAGIVTLINLCSDTCKSVKLQIPKEWLDSIATTYLDADGRWKEAAYEFIGGTVLIKHSLPLYHPLYLRFMREKH